MPLARGYDPLFGMYNVALDLEDIIVSLFQHIDIGEYEAAWIEFDYPLPWVIIFLRYQYKSNLVP